VFYIEVLKDFTKISSLRETKRMTGTVTNDFYFKIEVAYIKVWHLESFFETVFNFVDIRLKSAGNKKVINVNNNNNAVTVKDKRVNIKGLESKGWKEGSEGIILYIKRLFQAI